MFGNKQRRHNAVETLIGSNTRIAGDLHFTGGCHDPDSHAALTVSEDGNIDGGVTVPYVLLNGIVRGDVYANQRVELGPTARVIGNVYYNLIEMAIGAEINGKLVHQAEGQTPLLEQSDKLDQAAVAASET